MSLSAARGALGQALPDFGQSVSILPHTSPALQKSAQLGTAVEGREGALAPGSSWLIIRLFHAPTLLAKVSPNL